MENTQRERLSEYCRKLYRRGFMPGIDGNVSARLDSRHALVTPAGVCKERITPNALVLMALTGENLSDGLCPTSEAPMHLAAYRRRPDIGAVIHAHSVNATAFALARRRIDTRHAPFAFAHLGAIEYVPYCTPGSPALHEAVEAAFAKGHKALLLESHGMLTAGRDLPEAFALADLFEAYAGMLIRAQLLGGAYTLGGDELSKIRGG